MAWTWLIWVGAAYLAGSIPFALWLGWLRGVDIRRHGSGNVGASNAGRVLGRRWGVLCLVLDALKGAVPVVLAGAALGALGENPPPPERAWPWLAVAVAAVVGHVFPVWLHFRGGKGVATGLGVMLGLWPVLTLPALLAAGVWIVVISLTRYISVASIAAALVLPLYLALSLPRPGVTLSGQLPFLLVTLLLAALVVVRHRGNLARLRRGTEPKIGRGGEGEGTRGTIRQGDRETGRQGDKETGRQGDKETGRQGDRETGRQGDKETE